MADVNRTSVNYGTDTSTNISSTSNTTSSSSTGSPWTIYHIAGAIVTICFVLFLFWYFVIQQPEQIVSTSTNEGVKISTLSNVPLSGSAVPIVAPPVNLLPSQSLPPVNTVYAPGATHGDTQSPTGWVFKLGTYRVLDGDTEWGQGLRTPDGAPTYGILQNITGCMQTTIVNLQIGARYQILGYAASRPLYPVGAQFSISLVGGVTQQLALQTLPTFTFDPFGPVFFTATATTHTLEFHGQSKASDVLIGGLSLNAV